MSVDGKSRGEMSWEGSVFLWEKFYSHYNFINKHVCLADVRCKLVSEEGCRRRAEPSLSGMAWRLAHRVSSEHSGCSAHPGFCGAAGKFPELLPSELFLESSSVGAELTWYREGSPGLEAPA
jgi:hypothetical protein